MQPYVNAGTSAATIKKSRRPIGIPDLPSQVGLGPKPKPKPYSYPGGSTDPFAPYSGGDITSIIGHLTAMYGSPMTDAQIQTSAQGQIDPLIAAITKRVNTQASASSDAIRGLTDSYAKELSGINYSAPYQQAEGQQAAVDAALQQSLTGAGSDLASQLKQRLSVLGEGDPAVAQAAAGQAATGLAAGNTELAHGSSALSNLIAQGAAANSFGLKQPGIAKTAGLQGISGVQSQAVNDIASGTEDALGQLPAIVQALRNSNQSLRGDRASAAGNLFTTLTDQNVTKAGIKANSLNAANTAAANALPAFDPTASNTLHVKSDQYGDPIPGADGRPQPLAGYHYDKNGNVVKDAKPGTTKNGPTLTPGQKARIQTSAAKDAEDLFHGVTKPNPSDPANPTIVSYTATWNEAFKTMMRRYPSLGRAGVLKLLHTWYKPGDEYGTPYPKKKGVAQGGRVGQKPLTPAQIAAQVPKG